MIIIPELTLDELTLIFAIATVTLLIFLEISSHYYGQTKFTINHKKIRNTALFNSFFFFFLLALKVVLMIVGKY